MPYQWGQGQEVPACAKTQNLKNAKTDACFYPSSTYIQMMESCLNVQTFISMKLSVCVLSKLSRFQHLCIYAHLKNFREHMGHF